MKSQTTLVATLGGQPQIITFTLDLLLARGEQIDQVVVVYLSRNRRYIESYRRLMEEFVGDRYAGKPCHLRSFAVGGTGDPVEDVITPQEVDAVHSTFQALIPELKKQKQHIHLSLSGGRRILALVALEAAMRFLTPSDQIWHIYTPDALVEQVQDGQRMHLPLDSGIKLISVPFVPWAAYLPGVADLMDPTALRPVWLSPQDRQRCDQVWTVLPPRAQDALRIFAQGKKRGEVAKALHVELSTVDDYRQEIAHLCKETWQLSDTRQVDVAFMQKYFGPYLQVLKSSSI